MLYNIISNIKGCQIATIEQQTIVKIPKKYGINGQVEKYYKGQVQINYGYENAVNNRLEKQGDERTFKAEPLKWGEWEIANKVITHKGERYLRYYSFNGTNKPIVQYYVDGRKATAQELAIIKAYVAASKKPSATQSAEGLTENQVKPRVVNFSNILSLNVDGKTYTKEQTSLGMVG